MMKNFRILMSHLITLISIHVSKWALRWVLFLILKGVTLDQGGGFFF
jgi:hypothetical protein